MPVISKWPNMGCLLICLISIYQIINHKQNYICEILTSMHAESCAYASDMIMLWVMHFTDLRIN